MRIKLIQTIPFFLFFSLPFWVKAQKDKQEESMITGKKITVTANGQKVKKVNHSKEQRKRNKKQFRVLYIRANDASKNIKTHKRNRTYSEKNVVAHDTKKKKLDAYYLSGNICVDQVTRRYGFEYELVPKTLKMSIFKRFFHNLGVKTVIFFSHGPFWKRKMKKRIKDCMGGVHTS